MINSIIPDQKTKEKMQKKSSVYALDCTLFLLIPLPLRQERQLTIGFDVFLESGAISWISLMFFNYFQG
jgi:hypothetical protein